MRNIIVAVFAMTFFGGCTHIVIAPGCYKYPYNLTNNQQTSAWVFFELNVLPDSTYRYLYKNSGNYQEHSYGSWSITPSGRLMLWDTLSTVAQIPINVKEASHNDLGATIFEFPSDLEPSFWNLVINNVIYPVIDERVIIPAEINFNHFYLLGFNEKYDELNSPNKIVKTELYHVENDDNHKFQIILPDYAVNHEVLFYVPMNKEFIIKRKRLIQQDNSIELRHSD